jgi:3-phosphoshikimate 1-carboxyvinyltransferase
MQLFVKGTSAPLTGEVLILNSKYHAHQPLILVTLARASSAP